MTCSRPRRRPLRDTVARFVDAEVLPIIGQHFREGTFPAHLVPRLGELGVLGANLQGYGCAGLNTVSYGLVLQELERGDSGLRSFASVQGSLCMFPIHAYGSEEQKQRWLPGMARGALIGCFGLTEPDFGSNPGGMRTRARSDGDAWVLNGSKTWITNGTHRGRGRGVGQDGRGRPRVHPRLPRGEGDAWLHRPGDPRQVLPARLAPPASCPSRTCACPRPTCCPA